MVRLKSVSLPFDEREKGRQIVGESDEDSKRPVAAGSLRFKVEPFHVRINGLRLHSQLIYDNMHEFELLYILFEDRCGQKAGNTSGSVIL